MAKRIRQARTGKWQAMHARSEQARLTLEKENRTLRERVASESKDCQSANWALRTLRGEPVWFDEANQCERPVRMMTPLETLAALHVLEITALRNPVPAFTPNGRCVEVRQSLASHRLYQALVARARMYGAIARDVDELALAEPPDCA